MTVQGWSKEMDRKLADMQRDPQAYFKRAREDARSESGRWLARSSVSGRFVKRSGQTK